MLLPSDSNTHTDTHRAGANGVEAHIYWPTRSFTSRMMLHMFNTNKQPAEVLQSWATAGDEAARRTSVCSFVRESSMAEFHLS